MIVRVRLGLNLGMWATMTDVATACVKVTNSRVIVTCISTVDSTACRPLVTGPTLKKGQVQGT